MKTKLQPKEWTPKQLERLPAPGYWLNRYQMGSEIYYTAYCNMNGYFKYVRTDGANNTWGTLRWTCAPTTKEISQNPDQWYHFQTLDEMKERFPHLNKSFFEKPVNDF
jgi:hypothetical protein